MRDGQAAGKSRGQSGSTARCGIEFPGWEILFICVWKPDLDKSTSHPELDRESCVLSALMAKREGIFPQRREPWYQPDGKDSPKKGR